MTGPDESTPPAETPSPVAGQQEASSTPPDWAATKSTLGELFKSQREVELNQAEPPQTEQAGAGPSEPPAPATTEPAGSLPAHAEPGLPNAHEITSVPEVAADAVPVEARAGLDTGMSELAGRAADTATPAPPEGVSPPAHASELDTTTPATPTEPATVPTPANTSPPAAHAGVSDDLEEQVFAPTASTQGPQAGMVVDGYHLNQDLGRGWFTANALTTGPSLDVYARPNPSWAALKPHRLLPKISAAGGLFVLEAAPGQPVKGPLPTEVALGYTRELAQLLFALEKQGYALTDLDPAGVLLTPEGLKLRFPPRVAKLGEPPEAALREGVTPPEVQAQRPADARAGVYVLGAVLYGWLTGRVLPPEGPSLMMLGGVPEAGLPQLLYSMLNAQAKRLTPSELLAALKHLAAPALPAYQVAASTTVGLNPDRPTNEDSYGFNWRQVGIHGQDQLALRACVSDGMGGMAAGEVASAAAVRAFLNSDKATLTDMVWDANAAVLTDMQGRDGGCTLSGVQITGNTMQLGHVGDTRAYLKQGQEVRQISKDHSFVAAMVASGQLTEEEAATSPDRNKVLRSLGSVRQPQPDYVMELPEPVKLERGDRVLLVSDGVWGEVGTPRISELLLREASLQALTDQLVQLALDSGAPDNATALLIERIK